MLQITQVSKAFETPAPLMVLDRVSLSVKPGEFVSLVGPSGCGKTTLLRLVGGLEPFSEGTIGWGKGGGRVGFVFQKPGLLPWRTIEKNVVLSSEITGQSHVPVARLLELVGLSAFSQYYPDQVSGGMQQRAALARTLAHNPDVLLMDEPFAAIDELSRETLAVELQSILQEQPKTVLFVTHHLEEAVFLSDKVAVLSARPASVKQVVFIDLPRPRSIEIKHTQKFQEYVKCLRRSLMG